MSYRPGSRWNDTNELQCLLIFKKLKRDGFPYGASINYCRDLALFTVLKVRSISAKVGNYKSEAGITNSSNSSTNTKLIFQKYNEMSIETIESLLLL